MCAVAATIAVLVSGPGRADDRDAARMACFGPDAADPIAGCTALIERDGGDLAARVQRGDAHFAHADDEKATSDYRAVVTGEAITPNAFAAQGRAHASLGNVAEAHAAFAQALGLDPGNTFALIGRAWLHAEREEMAAALEDMTAAVAAAPDDPAIRLERIRLTEEVGDRGLRREDMEALVRLDYQRATWLPLLVSEALRTRDTAAALTMSERLLAIAPAQPSAHLARADALTAAGRREEALAEMKEALRLRPDDVLLAESINRAEARAAGRPDWSRMTQGEREEAAIAFVGHAAALIAMGMPERAPRPLDEALAADPRSVRALTLRARLRLAAGDAVQARMDVETALTIAPTDARLIGLRGLARAQSGDLDGAEDDLDAAIAALPEDAEFRRARAELRASHGDEQGARADREAAAQREREHPAP